MAKKTPNIITLNLSGSIDIDPSTYEDRYILSRLCENEEFVSAMTDEQVIRFCCNVSLEKKRHNCVIRRLVKIIDGNIGDLCSELFVTDSVFSIDKLLDKKDLTNWPTILKLTPLMGNDVVSVADSHMQLLKISGYRKSKVFVLPFIDLLVEQLCTKRGANKYDLLYYYHICAGGEPWEASFLKDLHKHKKLQSWFATKYPMLNTSDISSRYKCLLDKLDNVKVRSLVNI